MPNQSELKSTKKANKEQQQNGPERAENTVLWLKAILLLKERRQCFH